MKYRTYARFVAPGPLPDPADRLRPKGGERLSVQHGRLRLLQPGERLHPRPVPAGPLPCPIPPQPDASQPDASLPDKDQEDSSKPPRWRSQR